MTRKQREAPIVDAPIDRAAQLAKVLTENHSKGAHTIPLGKCPVCAADPDFHKKQDAARVAPIGAPESPALSGRKVKLVTAPVSNPTNIRPRRQAPRPVVADDQPIDFDALGQDAAIAALIPATPLLGEPVFTPDAEIVEVPADTKLVIVHPDGVDEQGRIKAIPRKRSTKEPVPPVVEQAPEPEQAPIVEIGAPVTLARVNGKGKPKTREEWLLRAVDLLRPDFEKAGLPIGEVRVSIGWMGGRGSKKNVIGQCWMPFSVEDKVPAIFLIPTLKKPVDILGVLVHELVHAGGCPGHRGKFATTAAKVGLMPPWPSTKPSDPLVEKLQKIADKLGDFPHAVINPGHGLGGDGPERPPVQGTRMLKVVCPEDDYTVRTTAKWLAVGMPSCPDGHEMERAE